MAGYAAFTGRKAAGQLIRLKYEDIRVGTELSKANLRPEHIQLLADDIRENGETMYNHRKGNQQNCRNDRSQQSYFFRGG